VYAAWDKKRKELKVFAKLTTVFVFEKGPTLKNAVK